MLWSVKKQVKRKVKRKVKILGDARKEINRQVTKRVKGTFDRTFDKIDRFNIQVQNEGTDDNDYDGITQVCLWYFLL